MNVSTFLREEPEKSKMSSASSKHKKRIHKTRIHKTCVVNCGCLSTKRIMLSPTTHCNNSDDVIIGSIMASAEASAALLCLRVNIDEIISSLTQKLTTTTTQILKDSHLSGDK